MRREVGDDHAAERLADRDGAVDPERVDELLVDEHEVANVSTLSIVARIDRRLVPGRSGA